LAMVAMRALVIRPRTLPGGDRSGQRRRDQAREIDQVSIAVEDPHPKQLLRPPTRSSTIAPRCATAAALML